ncbi:hypothetical protein B296_00017061 [Ensete ventricosum]|uniref:Uncharacterized protein n=1 Tax=Ensete ventricosum TaxID=4639 RepID=A0A427AAC0_ENSVE|nr:hypothetical protein B296_00017061 [Ensete ventricosum]
MPNHLKWTPFCLPLSPVPRIPVVGWLEEGKEAVGSQGPRSRTRGTAEGGREMVAIPICYGIRVHVMVAGGRPSFGCGVIIMRSAGGGGERVNRSVCVGGGGTARPTEHAWAVPFAVNGEPTDQPGRAAVGRGAMAVVSRRDGCPGSPA